MKRAAVLILLLCLLLSSAAAESADDEGRMLTVEGVFTLLCPADASFERRSASEPGAIAYTILLPGATEGIRVELEVNDLQTDMCGLSFASLTQEGREAMAQLLPPEQSSLLNQMKLLEITEDPPNGIACFFYRVRTLQGPYYAVYAAIRGWIVHLMALPIALYDAKTEECLDALKELTAAMTLLPGPGRPACASLFDLMTLDCPENWAFSDQDNEAYSSADENEYLLGVFVHEGNCLVAWGCKATRRSKKQDVSVMTAEQKQDYILEVARKYNAAGISATYQYTLWETEARIPFLVFYASAKDGSYSGYFAQTVYQGAQICLESRRIIEEVSDSVDEEEDLEILLSTLRLIPAQE